MRLLRCLEKKIQGALVAEPRILRFVTGKRKKLWNKNCLAVGLASGFLEPLESTSIHLAMKTILKFVEMLPVTVDDESTACEFNRVVDREYESVRDFIILHYCTTKRSDTAFWRSCASMGIPESLKTRLDLFKESGRLYKDEFDLFTTNSWYAVLEGMGVRPERIDPLVYLSHAEEVRTKMQKALALMDSATDKLLPHKDFLRTRCPAFEGS